MDIISVLMGLCVGSALGAFAWMRYGRQNAVLAARAEALAAHKAEADEEIGQLMEALTSAREQVTTLTVQKQGLEERMSVLQEEARATHEQNRLQFEQLATKIFEANSSKFGEQSQKSLNEMLNPMKERFSEFQNLVAQSFGAQANEQRTLKTEIERIVMQADGLTKALKGDNKAQGNWGEVMLERILEDAGLVRGRDYTAQGEGMGLRHAEHGGAVKPDYVINLPDGKHLIIDSKVSLKDYEQFCNAQDDTARLVSLKQHLTSVRNQVLNLAGKRYQDSGLGTPDFVLLFMPIEGAYALAVQQDAQLHSFAWDKKVVIVCPSTLFATMRTIASLWRIEQQNRNTQEISRQGADLYDKFVGFVSDLQSMGEQLGRTQKFYDAAMNKLSEGKGNLINRAESMRKLGLKPSKALPKELLEAVEEDDTVLTIAS